MIAAVVRVARMQLAVAVRSPIAWLTVAGFLVLQGVSFAALVAVLSDPGQPAPVGAVLEGHFAGTPLGWAIQLTAIAAIAARAAEDRRTGAWEALVTAPIGEGAALVGTWLGGVALYAIAWLPTVTYALALAAWAPGGASFDLGPAVAGYLGGLALGATALAVALAAGATLRHGLAATMAGFALLMLWLMIGELGRLWPQLAAERSALAAAIDRFGPRPIALALARGQVAPAQLVWLAGLTASALAIATAAVGVGRRRRGPTALALIRGTLAVVAAALVAILVERGAPPWDVSASGRNHLDPVTIAALDRVDAPVELTVVAPAIDRLAPLFVEVERVAGLLGRRATVRVRRAGAGDAALVEAATAAALDPQELARGGAVVIRSGGRQRVLGLLDLVEVGRDAIDAPAFTSVQIEQALARAVIELGDDAPRAVCTVTGRGEEPAAWAAVWARLVDDGVAIEALDAPTAIPASCTAVAVVGARAAWPAPAQRALAAYVEGGGAVIVGAAAALDAPLGPDAALASWGLGLGRGRVDDPDAAVDDAGGFRVIDGYQPHPITDGFAGRRVSLWRAARPLVVAAPARPIVTTSARARLDGASDGAQVLLAVAEVGQGRIAVVSGAAVDDVGAALLVARAIAWQLGRTPAIAVPAKPGDQLRLALTASERRALAAVAVLGLPLAMVALLAALARWARR